ncbi:hypothetical protein HJD18_11370 [Thermoleophilia bacterium SCSIO 60948]|nr:hypothetical protein HJD18_11370 [Thermoleophilia bacterium SCSIO 60948]
MNQRTIDRAIGGIATGVGIAAAISPRHLLRAYGVDAAEVTGSATLGWRLFAARNLVIGPRVFQGDADARRTAIAVQALDQAAFLAALRNRDVPAPTAIAAMATSGAIIALGLLGRDGESARTD